MDRRPLRPQGQTLLDRRHTGHWTEGDRNNILMLSETHTKDIWGAVIGFTEATVVWDNFPSFTAFSCAHAKAFTLFDLFVFQGSLHPHKALHCQTYIYIIHLYSHLREMK